MNAPTARSHDSILAGGFGGCRCRVSCRERTAVTNAYDERTTRRPDAREAKGETVGHHMGWNHGRRGARRRAGREPARADAATGRRCSTALQRAQARQRDTARREVALYPAAPAAAARRRSRRRTVAARCVAARCRRRARSISPRSGHRHLIDLLTPQPRRFVPDETLRGIQRHFHAMMLGRIAHLRVDALRLPNSNRCWNSTRGPTAYGSACRACMAASAMRCTPTAPRPCSCRRAGAAWSAARASGTITAHGCTLVERLRVTRCAVTLPLRREPWPLP